jgi:hypothetical protein
MTGEWKIGLGGREWWTRAEPDARVLAGLLRQRWPEAVVALEHSSPHGFYDADSGLSVDGHRIERWEWRPGESEPVRIE